MKQFNDPSRLTVTLAILVTALFLITANAIAAIDPDAVYKTALEKVELAASEGDVVILNAAAYDASLSASDNQMTIQEACHQIAFVTITAAAASGQSIESVTQAAVNGVSNAANELTKRIQAAGQDPDIPELELDTRSCAIHGIRAAAELIDLDVEALIASLQDDPLADPEAFEPAEIPEFDGLPEASATEVQIDSTDPSPQG
jgi:hypothetical protein